MLSMIDEQYKSSYIKQLEEELNRNKEEISQLKKENSNLRKEIEMLEQLAELSTRCHTPSK